MAEEEEKPFKPPCKADAFDGLGLHPELDKVFTKFLQHVTFDSQSEESLIRPMPLPGPQDWLSRFPTEPEPFEKWESREERNEVVAGKNTIYIMPIGEFSEEQTTLEKQPKDKKAALSDPFLAELLEYAEIFFYGLPVKMLPRISVESLDATTRMYDVARGVKRKQLQTKEIFLFLHHMLPRDAYCVLAITMLDLYPDRRWNFVFGQASTRDRIGVFSFARNHPDFFTVDKPVSLSGLSEVSELTKQMMIWRSCNILTHEITHMFGLEHCVYFSCIMNGRNHQDESDKAGSFLCPICLHKLQHSIGFDFVARYKAMLAFYKSRLVQGDESLLEEDFYKICTDWLERALALIKECQS